jgi:hypothetical protein
MVGFPPFSDSKVTAKPEQAKSYFASWTGLIASALSDVEAWCLRASTALSTNEMLLL